MHVVGLWEEAWTPRAQLLHTEASQWIQTENLVSVR